MCWFASANHGGGHSFRICKKPAEWNTGLTEECIQENPLKFEGDKIWVTYPSEDQSVRHEFKATEGTFPEGSEWTEGPLTSSLGLGHMIDNVRVPQLEQGEYVLSFRWDCMRSNQVWNMCSNINIVWDKYICYKNGWDTLGRRLVFINKWLTFSYARNLISNV